MIITIALTRDEGYVVGLGGLQRVRKIFVGCPAIRPIWDQSPGRTASRFETVGNRLYPLHDQDCLRRFTAEAQIQDRSRAKTGLNTAPAFSRVYNIPSPSMERARVRVTPQIPPVIPAQAGTQRKQSTPSPPSFPRRREPRENKARRLPHPNQSIESKQHRASEPDFSKTYFLWISTDSITSPCSMARTTSMPSVTFPKTAWQEVPWTWQGFS